MGAKMIINVSQNGSYEAYTAKAHAHYRCCIVLFWVQHVMGTIW